MSTFTTDWSAEQIGSTAEHTGGTAEQDTPVTLVAVVGFDGSDPSKRALQAATRLLVGRKGRIEVVWVAHLSSAESLSSDAVVEVERGFNDIERDLSQATRTLMGGEQRWSFGRRDGMVAHELLEVATPYVERHDGSQVVLVVGASSHRYHQVMGSVPTSLVRHAKVPVLVVP
jgi:nucleotide-binding universal stress UspA family protein